MLMRKASAFRISWSYHLYRASLPEGTGLLLRSRQRHLLLGEKYYTTSPTTSAVDNCRAGCSIDRRPPIPLIVRTVRSQNLPILSSNFGNRGFAPAAGASNSSGSTLGSLDGFLPRGIHSLLRQNSYRAAVHDGAQERSSYSTHDQAPLRDNPEENVSEDWSTDFSVHNSIRDNECGWGTKSEDPWTPWGMRELQGFVAGLTDVKDFESSEPSQSEKRKPMSKAVNLERNLVPHGRGCPSSSALTSIAGNFGWRGFRDSNSISRSNVRSYSSDIVPPTKECTAEPLAREYSQRAVITALWCNFLVFSLKLGVWIMTSSPVMLAEAIHSLADLANQGLLAYGLMSSKRAPDAMHPYGYTKERFVWSLISAVGIFCLGAGATIIHGVQNLFSAQPLENVYLAAFVIAGSMIMEGASLLVAISCVRNGAKAEGMTFRDYLWRGHDPTTVAVMMEVGEEVYRSLILTHPSLMGLPDGAAVTGLVVAGLALAAAHYTGNPMWDPIGSIVVGNLLGVIAIFLIQSNRQALLGRSMDDVDMMRVISLLSKDPVVDAIYDCKSEVIGPSAYRFKAEIDFNGVVVVQNYLKRAGRGNWHKEFNEAVKSAEPGHLDRVMAAYGEEVVSALGSEIDRLEKEIQRIVPGIRHVDIEAHNPKGPVPRERFYIY